MTIFSCNNLSKAFNDKILFEDIAFGLDSGDRIGIIGKNGAGKTTLMKIVAGLETADEGTCVFNNKVRFEYLDQMSEFTHSETALDFVMNSRPELFASLMRYKKLCTIDTQSSAEHDELQQLIHDIEIEGGWDFEREAKIILNKLGIKRLHEDISKFSGGLKKRVALARALLSNPDLLIMDEPTNHLDADSVQWLQDRLQNAGTSLLFVTHDRYFLDAVSTRILEIVDKKILNYPGNYEAFLEKKENFMRSKQAVYERTLSKLRTELAWLQKGAKARRTKQKSRIDWIEEMRKSAVLVKEKKIKIELGTSFMGSRIIEAHGISKSIGSQLLFKDFTYIAQPKDRIGIIGPNGSGKSTLLSMLAGFGLHPDKGRIEIGGTANIGYFKQELTDLKPNNSVIGTIKEVAEYIDVGEGRDRYLTCRDLLDRFLFPRYQHTSLISTLSGGERRRLALIKVLMANPNVLLLDEPTNDFDLDTLGALEDYLDNFFGVLIIVSHDRSFLDRTVEHVFAFDGEGNIKKYPGNYSIYLEKREKELQAARAKEQENAEPKQKREKNSASSKKKLSYKEQREFDELEILIPELESQKSEMETTMYSGEITDYVKLEELSKEFHALENKLSESIERWMELSEKTDD